MSASLRSTIIITNSVHPMRAMNFHFKAHVGNVQSGHRVNYAARKKFYLQALTNRCVRFLLFAFKLPNGIEFEHALYVRLLKKSKNIYINGWISSTGRNDRPSLCNWNAVASNFRNASRSTIKIKNF